MNDLPILKTYKLFINGQFPRTESGRHLRLEKDGKHLANICRATRKDFRNAVVAARGAQGAWWGKTAYNRSQILYRLAEMLQAKKAQLKSDLYILNNNEAELEIQTSIDALVSYAGWCDKYNQLFSSVNPVQGSYFNFSTLEPMGVAAFLLDDSTSFSGFIKSLCACITAGNTVVAFVPKELSLAAISFAEIIQNSDVPAGVINILTGLLEEVQEHAATHMDVNALFLNLQDARLIAALKEKSNENLKRVIVGDFLSNDEVLTREVENSSPYAIRNFSELKTTWHPIESIGASGGGY